jgi:hypothetical protein
MGAESVKLAWQPAIVSPVIKKPPPVTYRLEAQELPASDWLPLSSRLSDTSHYLSDLLPDRDYNVRVRAENKYGLSEPTEPIWIPRAKGICLIIVGYFFFMPPLLDDGGIIFIFYFFVIYFFPFLSHI